MGETGREQTTDGVRDRPVAALLKSQEMLIVPVEPSSPDPKDRRLATLVHQGSDPTRPHQALATRESAMLFNRVCPLGTKGVPGPTLQHSQRGSLSPDSDDLTTCTPRRANTIGSTSPSNCGPRRPPESIRSSSSTSGFASAA